MPDESSMGDEVYQPPEADERDPGDAVDFENSLNAAGQEERPEERGYSPPEKPLAVTHYGVTAAEQRAGEPLEQRLSEEVPDISAFDEDDDGIGDQPGMAGEPLDDEVGDLRAGRLVAPDEGVPRSAAEAEAEADLFAEDVGVDSAAASSEEAAVHLIDEESSEPDA